MIFDLAVTAFFVVPAQMLQSPSLTPTRHRQDW
jgi:hypothetical protein